MTVDERFTAVLPRRHFLEVCDLQIWIPSLLNFQYFRIDTTNFNLRKPYAHGRVQAGPYFGRTLDKFGIL